MIFINTHSIVQSQRLVFQRHKDRILTYLRAYQVKE